MPKGYVCYFYPCQKPLVGWKNVVLVTWAFISIFNWNSYWPRARFPSAPEPMEIPQWKLQWPENKGAGRKLGGSASNQKSITSWEKIQGLSSWPLHASTWPYFPHLSQGTDLPWWGAWLSLLKIHFCCDLPPHVPHRLSSWLSHLCWWHRYREL